MADLGCEGCGGRFIVASEDLRWLIGAIEVFEEEHAMCRHPASTVYGHLRSLGVIK
jgi:uncharacterized protein (UPF0335 family)